MTHPIRRRAIALAVPALVVGLLAACQPNPSESGDATIIEGTPVAQQPTIGKSYDDARRRGLDTYADATLTDTLEAPNGAMLASATAEVPVSIDDPVAAWTDADSAAVNPQMVSALSASGCRTVSQTVTHHSLLGFTLFRWTWAKHWCWISPFVGGPTATTTIGSVDALWNYQGRIARQWYYYDGGRGHKGYRMDKFGGPCLPFGLGCSYAYPWAQVRSHGDGGYSSARGIA
jgi:hypothetical protein